MNNERYVNIENELLRQGQQPPTIHHTKWLQFRTLLGVAGFIRVDALIFAKFV